MGTASAVVFLSINGYELNPDLDNPDSKTKQTKFEKVVLSVASGEIKKSEIARFFEENAVEL